MKVVPPVEGRVSRIVGVDIEVRGLRLAVGAAVAIDAPSGVLPGEVVAVGENGLRVAALGDVSGLGRGAVVRPTSTAGQPVGTALLGRIVDAMGRPIDGLPRPVGPRGALEQAPPGALKRRRITDPMPVGVRVVDALMTLGRGQRIGLFAGSGVGKSTLLGMMARGADADAVVICLVGERGREVREFLEDDLGPTALARSAVVVATSDQPALVRVRAARYATAIAEHLADQGADVLFLCDSLTRFALAQREIGLAAGEPPAARGFTPSVFAALPKLLERTGPREHGTITALYTVLVDGDDHNDPIADTVRGILDGHIVLDRRLALAGRYPAIDPLASVSRLATKVLPPEAVDLAAQARAALAAAESVRDLVEVGAYVPGTNPDADRGLALAPALIDLCRQRVDDVTPIHDTFQALASIMATAPDLTASGAR